MHFIRFVCLSFIYVLSSTCTLQAETGFRTYSSLSHPYFYMENLETTPALSLIMSYLPNQPVILEAGAYIGTESVIMSKIWPEGHVHAFEPVPEIYHSLQETTKSSSNISTYPLALSQTNGAAIFYISEDVRAPNTASASSSLRPPKEHLDVCDTVTFPRTITVQTQTLDSWAQANQINHVDFLWLDMQGSELEMLMASPEILKTVQVILTETIFIEAYQGQYLFPEMKKWMEEQGFSLIGGNFNPENPREEGRWFGDAIFVKADLL
jgi:2-O-methyltransferase